MASAYTLDDFDQAVLIAFEATTAGVTSEVKQRATSYLEHTKLNGDSWRAALGKFKEAVVQKKPDYISFWALEIILYAVHVHYDSQSEESKNQIRTEVFLFIRDILPHAGLSLFLKTKLAAICVGLVYRDYPAKWPTFFTDLLGIMPPLGHGTQSIELYGFQLTVLRIFHDELVSTESRGMRTDPSVSMRIKDAMRDSCIHTVVDAVRAVAAEFAQSQPAIAIEALRVLEQFVVWVDVDLVVNDRFFPFMYKLASSADCAVTVRVEALNLLTGLMTKGLLPLRRVAVIQQIDVFGFINSFSFSEPIEEEYELMFSLPAAGIKFLNATVVGLCETLSDICAGYLRSHTQHASSSGSHVRATKPKQNTLSNLKSNVFGKKTLSPLPSPTVPQTIDEFQTTLAEDDQAAFLPLRSFLQTSLLPLLRVFDNENYAAVQQCTEAFCEVLTLLRFPELLAVDGNRFVESLLPLILSKTVAPASVLEERPVISGDRSDDFAAFRVAVVDRILKNAVHVNATVTANALLRFFRQELQYVYSVAMKVPNVQSTGNFGNWLSNPAEIATYPLLNNIAAALNTSPNILGATAVSNTGNSTVYAEILTQAGTAAPPAFNPASMTMDQAVMFTQNLDCARVEAFLHILYTAGECLPTFNIVMCFEPQYGMVGSVLCSPLSYVDHVHVKERWLSVVFRLSRFITLVPDVFNHLILSLLDQRAILHPNSFVRERTCYFFVKIVKGIEQGLKRSMEGVVKRVLLTIVPLIKADVANTAGTSVVLCEAFGALCLGLPVDVFVEALSSIFYILVEPITQTLASVDAFSKNCPQQLLASTVHYILNVSSLLKELGAEPQNEAFKASPALFQQLERVIGSTLLLVEKIQLGVGPAAQQSISAAAAKDPSVITMDQLQQRCVVLLHTLLELLKERSLTWIQPVLEPFIVHASPEFLPSAVQLVNQLLTKFGPELQARMEHFLAIIVGKYASTLAAFPDKELDASAADLGIDLTAGLSEQRQLRDCIRKSNVVFYKELISHDLAALFFTPASAERNVFGRFLETTLGLVTYTRDMSISKVSVNVIRLLAQHVLGLDNNLRPAGPAQLPQDVIQSLFVQRLLPVVFTVALHSPGFSPQDVQCATIIRELTTLLRLYVIATKTGPDGFMKMLSQVCALPVDTQLAERLFESCSSTSQQATVELRDFIIDLRAKIK